MNVGRFNVFNGGGIPPKKNPTPKTGALPDPDNETKTGATNNNLEVLTGSLDLLARTNALNINSKKASATHEYTSVDDLIKDLNDGKFKKGDTVILHREKYSITYKALRNGRLKRQ